MINTGLAVSDVVNVSVSLSAVAAQTRNFGIPLFLGDSGVIDTLTRYRVYSNLTGVGGDFSSSSPEYLAAQAFFSQNPQPVSCYIGAWAANPTPAVLVGAVLSASAQNIGNFNTITNGGIVLVINGSTHSIQNLNLLGVTNLNAVASAITAALSGAGTCIWNANQNTFQVSSTATGASATVAFATTGTGTDLSVPMGLAASVSGSYSVPGIAAEQPIAAAQALASLTNGWYGLQFAATSSITDAQHTAVANFIQGASPSRIYAITTQEAAVLNGGSGTSIGNSLSLNRTFCQFSSSNASASAAALGIAFSTDFEGDDTLYTLMFKQEAGVTAENLNETQAANLKAAHCNVFVEYNNATAILQWGTMSDGTFFDIIHGTDWLQNDLQVAIFNLMLTSRKVAQTDPGVNQILTTICHELEQARANALVAPGTWNGPPIGPIVTGQFFPLGYFVFAPPIASQSQASRAARISPVLTACIKLAGAIHTTNLIVNVNP